MNYAPSTETQRARLLEWLQTEGGIATSEARELLGIMSPAARVYDLKRQGYDILTHKRYIADEQGVLHCQAIYFLGSGDHAQ